MMPRFFSNVLRTVVERGETGPVYRFVTRQDGLFKIGKNQWGDCLPLKMEQDFSEIRDLVNKARGEEVL